MLAGFISCEILYVKAVYVTSSNQKSFRRKRADHTTSRKISEEAKKGSCIFLMFYITELKYNFTTMQRKKMSTFQNLCHIRWKKKKYFLVFHQNTANNDLVRYKPFCLMHWPDSLELRWLKWTVIGMKWMPKAIWVRPHHSGYQTNSNQYFLPVNTEHDNHHLYNME